VTSVSGRPAFWLFSVFLAGSVLVVSSEQLGYVATLPGAWLLSLVLLAVTAIPAGIIIYRFDQFEPEPASLIAVAVIWGGLIALTFAALTNSYFLSFLQNHLSPGTFDAWGPAIVAPIDEELYKGAGLVAIYLMAKGEFNSLMDGLVYGAMIGLGFQVMENVQYFLHAAAQSGVDQLGAVVGTYFVRVVLAGLYSHTLFSGLMGFGFAYAVTRRDVSRPRRFGVAALFAVLAWAAHFVWNSPWLDSLMGQSTGSFIVAVAIKGVPFLAFLVILAGFAHRRERQAFDRLIAAEIGSDVLSEAEFKILEKARRRRAALRAIKRNRGPQARALLKRLQREQMNLALFHGKVDTGHPALEAQRDKIRSLRAHLAGLP
jgi:RsiW-degrading membrane proteinase PrsW (M82 family)